MGTAGEITGLGAEGIERGMEAEGLMLVLSKGFREKVTDVEEAVGDDEHTEVVDAVVMGCVEAGTSCMRGAKAGGEGRVSGSSSSESSKAVISAAERLRAGRET